jgi:hypothetical protein
LFGDVPVLNPRGGKARPAGEGVFRSRGVLEQVNISLGGVAAAMAEHEAIDYLVELERPVFAQNFPVLEGTA